MSRRAPLFTEDDVVKALLDAKAQGDGPWCVEITPNGGVRAMKYEPKKAAPSPDPIPLPSTITQLYRHFDDQGTLLYVGISFSAIIRLYQHKSSHWFNSIANVTIENFPTREAAIDAEIMAIQTEEPRFNISGRVDAA